MTSERLFNSFIHPQKLLYPPKQISGYAPGDDQYKHILSRKKNIQKHFIRKLYKLLMCPPHISYNI